MIQDRRLSFKCFNPRLPLLGGDALSGVVTIGW